MAYMFDYLEDLVNLSKEIVSSSDISQVFHEGLISIGVFINYWEQKYNIKAPDFIKKQIEKYYSIKEGFTDVLKAEAWWNRLEQWYLYGREE